jgi:hypothetical protein
MPFTSERRLTPERFAQGMTFQEYVAYTGTPENLARESGWWLGTERKDLSDLLRTWYAGPARMSETQAAAIRWLAAQPNGPAKILVISEEWSSDCRRDVTMLARMAEAGGLGLRIFSRDGQRLGREPRADPAKSPNADLMNMFLREHDGRTFQSIPIAAFYTKDFQYLWHYTEYPAIYHKDRLSEAMRASRPGETAEQAWDRFMRQWRELQQSPFFPIWTSAAANEILSALYERVTVGPSAQSPAASKAERT